MTTKQRILAYLEEQGGHVKSLSGRGLNREMAIAIGANAPAVTQSLTSLEQAGEIVRHKPGKQHCYWIALAGREPPLESGMSGRVRVSRIEPSPGQEPAIASQEPAGAPEPAGQVDRRHLADALLAIEAEFVALQDRYASAVDELALLRQRVADLEGELAEFRSSFVEVEPDEDTEKALERFLASA